MPSISAGRRAVLTRDVVHHPLQMAEPGLKTNSCNDHDQAIRTRRSFLER